MIEWGKVNTTRYERQVQNVTDAVFAHSDGWMPTFVWVGRGYGEEVQCTVSDRHKAPMLSILITSKGIDVVQLKDDFILSLQADEIREDLN